MPQIKQATTKRSLKSVINSISHKETDEMPTLLHSHDDSETDSDDKDTTLKRMITSIKNSSNQRGKRKTPSIEKHNVNNIPNTNHFIDEESDGDDVLNEKISEKSKIEAIEKATKIMIKYRNSSHHHTNPYSTDS